MNETISERRARLAWWREARFGLFVHWGVYAVPGGFYRGRREPYYAEWLMLRAKIPCAEYRNYANAFTAEAFDPHAWVRAAKDAGMRYLVITTKHHDGFALFDSTVNDWTMPSASPSRRDSIRELVDACRAQQLPIGFYYSQAQDWMNGGAATGGHWDDSQKRSMDEYVDGVVIPHLRELLTQYGPDVPAMLWWDTPVGMDEARARRIEAAVQELRPGLIMNNRLYVGHTGDILTPEQRIPEAGYPGRDWETCMTMNNTWGFAHDDQDWKSSRQLIRNLVDIVSKGGNYLLNVGPDAAGRIPQASLDRLAEIGAWMRVNGQAIIGAEGVRLDTPIAWGRCTTRDKTLYVHVLDWPGEGNCVVPVRADVLSATLLGAPDTAVSFELTSQGLRLDVPGFDAALLPVVVAVKLARPIDLPALPLNRPDAHDTLLLPAANALLLNTRDAQAIPKAVLGGKEATLTYWKSADEACRWRARVDKPGLYRVRMHYSVGPDQAGSRFELTLGRYKLDHVLAPTASWVDYQWFDLGTVALDAPDEFLVTLKPTLLSSAGGFLNLKALSLALEPSTLTQ